MLHESTLKVLEEVDSICCAGGELQWGEVLQRVPLEDRDECLRIALGIAFEYHTWDLDWLKQTFDSHPEFSSRGLRCDLIRNLYHDQLSAGSTSSWNGIEMLGFSAPELDLRDKFDPTFLGDVVGGRYLLNQRIGAGGFGVVYRARDCVDDCWVAVKGPLCQSTERTTRAMSFIRAEADFLRGFDEGVPSFIALVEGELNSVYLVMEYVEGTSLLTAVKDYRLTFTDSLRVVAGIAETIDRFHARGNVHRDLKPENVIIRHDLTTCVLDFGISLAESTQFTAEQSSSGTLGYMAPEQVLGLTSQLDGRADVFSLGVVLFELVTGRHLAVPRRKEDWLVQSLVKNADDFPETIPERVRWICRKCLAREPDERFNTAAELASEIRAWLAGGVHARQDDNSASVHLLAGWRMGLSLGGALENLAYFRRHLKTSQECEAATEGSGQRELATALGFGFGAIIGVQEFAKLASGEQLVCEPFAEGEKFGPWFYRQGRVSIEERRDIENSAEALRRYLESEYVSMVQALRRPRSRAASLFELAVKAVLVQLSPEALADIPRIAREAGLEESIWSSFIAAAQNGVRDNALKRELDRMDKRVERFFLHGNQGQVDVTQSLG